MIGLFDRLARPLLRAFDPEDAHSLVIKALKAVPVPPSPPDDLRLGVRAFGLNFPNPVGLAAGLAVSLHPQALFLVPALLLLLDRHRWPRQLITLLLSGLVGPLLTLLALRLLDVPWPALAEGYAGDPQLFFTPAQLFTPAHWWATLNNLWLAMLDRFGARAENLGDSTGVLDGLS